MATRTRKTAGNGAADAQVTEVVQATEATAETTKKAPTKRQKPKVKKMLDPNMYVTVKNGFHGILTYHDKSTGERYRWNEFGDEIDLTVSTLQKVRSAHVMFFEENWFLIDDQEVIQYLNATQYYKNALSYEEFAILFDMDVDEIKERIAPLSKNQKRGIVYMAKEKIESGELYNLNIIRALESALETELII